MDESMTIKTSGLELDSGQIGQIEFSTSLDALAYVLNVDLNLDG
jgi:hypothetical protein